MNLLQKQGHLNSNWGHVIATVSLTHLASTKNPMCCSKSQIFSATRLPTALQLKVHPEADGKTKPSWIRALSRKTEYGLWDAHLAWQQCIFCVCPGVCTQQCVKIQESRVWGAMFNMTGLYRGLTIAGVVEHGKSISVRSPGEAEIKEWAGNWVCAL